MNLRPSSSWLKSFFWYMRRVARMAIGRCTSRRSGSLSSAFSARAMTPSPTSRASSSVACSMSPSTFVKTLLA
nr:hypothetical protein [Bacteroides sp. An19]